MQPSKSRLVDRAYVATAATAFGAFVAGAALLSVTLPYHGWDAFAFGDWSRRIADGGSIDPVHAGELGAGRPLFYVLQGGLWALTGGVSFTAGRLLSLGFAVGLVVCVAGAARALSSDRRLGVGAAAAVVVIIAIPAFTQEAIAGDSDVPAAAMVALCAWLAFRRRSSWAAATVLASAALAAVLTKPTVLAPLVGLGAWLLLERSRPLQQRLPLESGIRAASRRWGSPLRGITYTSQYDGSEVPHLARPVHCATQTVTSDEGASSGRSGGYQCGGRAAMRSWG